MIRLLYFCAARYNIHVMITHIAGVDNVIADAISRFKKQCFKLLAPNAGPLPDHTYVFQPCPQPATSPVPILSTIHLSCLPIWYQVLLHLFLEIHDSALTSIKLDFIIQVYLKLSS